MKKFINKLFGITQNEKPKNLNIIDYDIEDMKNKLSKPMTQIWTKWELKSSNVEKEPIMRLRYATITEPGDEYDFVPTGKYENRNYEIWVRYRLSTNEPEYKKIILP